MVFQILDPAEIEFPFEDVTLFKGLEEIGRTADRAAGAARGIPRAAATVHRRAEEALPRDAHRFPPDEQRRLAGRRAERIPGDARGDDEVSNVNLRARDASESPSMQRIARARMLANYSATSLSQSGICVHALTIVHRSLLVFVTPCVCRRRGLCSASIPIIIHMLNRRRFKTVEWAAMEFLLRAMRKNRRRRAIRAVAAAGDAVQRADVAGAGAGAAAGMRRHEPRGAGGAATGCTYRDRQQLFDGLRGRSTRMPRRISIRRS